jgi:hypothetical protein
VPLAQQLWVLWNRVRRSWAPYLSQAGLDLTDASEETLLRYLLQPIAVNFTLQGLEDLSRQTCRGIEPGDPARSLLYHVLTSPHVLPEGIPQEDFPTIRDIDLVENCVFAASFPSIADLMVRAEGSPLAIVVFAYEYAPAIDTVHQRHADMCFSRTGISRVGNADACYVPTARGFLPNSGGAGLVHVIPARFGAFIATQKRGNKRTIGPERFHEGDEQRKFWIPLHKLFRGPECLRGFDLDLEIAPFHVNEKIRRVHIALQTEGVSTGWTLSDLTKVPFRITEELGVFCPDEGLLRPIPHPLVEPARTEDGRYVGFPVPPNHDTLKGSLWFKDYLEARRWPEFVHVKHALENGKIVYLPKRTDADIVDIVKRGGFVALNFVDHTADGWLEARCPALAVDIPQKLSAYSLIAQPDFFPLVKQQELAEWWENSAPREIKSNIWADTDSTPSPLSGSRLPANISLEAARFDSKDETITAIVGFDRTPGLPAQIVPGRVRRESTLSYRATNLFQPGWDSSIDFNRDANSPGGTFHLANHGLGSPFPEDTLICAASGSFWPGAVPDITRFFPPHIYPSVTPLLDRNATWDDLPLPKRVRNGVIEYQVFSYADYVKIMYEQSIAFETFAETTLEDYVARTLVVARVYQVLGAATREERAKYALLSFRRPTGDEFEDLLAETGIKFDAARSYRLEIALLSHLTPVPKRFDRIRAALASEELLFADPATVARQDLRSHGWTVTRF